MELHAGQCWTYRAPRGFETSRILIGAIATFGSDRSIVCCSVTDAPRRQADGNVERVTIAFLPITEPAFRATVVSLEGSAELPDSFATHLEGWSNDPRGFTTFTVPFDGHLDHLIAQQMASLGGQSAA